MNVQDYIPAELWREAQQFVKDVGDDVEIYKVICKTEAVVSCEEADKFCAYWSLESYERYPHALITLYENKPLIDERFSIADIMDPFECLKLRFKYYYLTLKEKGMID